MQIRILQEIFPSNHYLCRFEFSKARYKAPFQLFIAECGVSLN